MSSKQMDFIKTDTTDLQEGYYTLSAATTSAYDTAKSLDPGTIATGNVEVRGRRNAELRIFCNASAGTVTFAVKCWPHDNQDELEANTRLTGKGWVAYSGVWTCNGSTTPSKNPLTGVTDAEVWYEATADTTNTHVAGDQVLMFPASGTAAASGYEKRLMIDTHACKRIAAEVTAIGTASKALIGLRFVD